MTDKQMEEILDSDGENLAVRAFLQLYGADGGVTLRNMCRHLSRSGFDGCWPDWVTDPKCQGHLTKGGAQSWLRHLFSLEKDQGDRT